MSSLFDVEPDGSLASTTNDATASATASATPSQPPLSPKDRPAGVSSVWQYFVSTDHRTVIALRFTGMRKEMLSAKYFRNTHRRRGDAHFMWLVGFEAVENRRRPIKWKRFRRASREELLVMQTVGETPNHLMNGADLLRRIDDMAAGRTKARHHASGELSELS